jgi:hypothetical protein
VVLAAIGLWYDDYTAGGPNPVTPKLLSVLGYSTGVQNNDTTFKTAFPYVQTPWEGFGRCGGPAAYSTVTGINDYGIGVSAPKLVMLQNYPNPFRGQTTFKFHLNEDALVTISIYDLAGKKVGTAIHQRKSSGDHEVIYNADHLSTGVYIANLSANNYPVQAIKISIAK